MFGMIRLVALCLIAFVAGVFYERSNQQAACMAAGGDWTSGAEASYCRGGG